MPPHLYIHIPFCDGKCHYCGFYSVVAAPGVISLYSTLPAQELALLQARRPNPARSPFRTIYIGGGTPSMLGSDGFLRLYETLSEHMSFDEVEEWTVELNPATVTPSILKTLRAIGVNRISIGVQSFDDATLARIGRRHTAMTAERAIKTAQDTGFDNTGIDLIASLPGVTSGLWQETLEHAVRLGLKHLSVYALSLESGTTLAAQVRNGLQLADDDAQLAALAQAEAVLTKAGFARYEISNYALPGFECRHNVGIWRGNDYLGLGPAAASRIGRQRWTNGRDVSDYIETLAQDRPRPDTPETLSEADDAVERAIFALRLAEGMDPCEDARRFPALRPRVREWEIRLQQLSKEGIAERGGRRWRLTARGREVCDAVLRELV